MLLVEENHVKFKGKMSEDRCSSQIQIMVKDGSSKKMPIQPKKRRQIRPVTHHMITPQIVNKKVRVLVETSNEWGALTPNEVDKTRMSSVMIVGRSGIVKRSA